MINVVMRRVNETAPTTNKRRQKTSLATSCIALIIGCGFASGALASENGLSHYPNGINTVLNGTLPEPGTLQYYNYSEFYDATSFVGSDGKKLIPGFHADIAVEGPRPVYTWPTTLGPFHLSSGIVPAFANISVSADGHSGSEFGLADLDLEPLYLSFSNPKHTFFAYFGPDVYLPTGSYNKNRLVNLGNNYVTITPALHATWFVSPKVELDASFVPELNFTNPATHYRSGDSIDVDYAVHLRPFSSMPKLRFALQGYVYKQFQDDTVSGVKYGDGFRGQAVAIGPQIEYDIVPHGGILLKFQQEVAVQNRPKGSRIWLEYAQPIYGK